MTDYQVSELSWIYHNCLIVHKLVWKRIHMWQHSIH